jgi:MFS family permease
MSGQAAEISGRSSFASLVRPLRNRNFVLLWFGQSVSSVGNGMYAITLAWAVYSLTHSASKMGIVLAANVVPQLCLALFGGVLADRVERRLVILATNIAAAAITGFLALAASHHSLGAAWIVAASFGLGVATAFFVPAFSAIFKDVLSSEERTAANSLRGVTSNVVRLISPALGGLVYAAGGATLGFGLDAVSFLVAVIAVAVSNIPHRKMHVPGTIFSEIGDGVKYIVRTAWLRNLILTALVTNTLCIAPIEVLLALVVRDAHHSSSFLGSLLSGQAAFAAVGSAIIGRFSDRIRALTGFFALSGVLAAGVAITGAAASVSLLLFVGVSLIGVGFSCNVLEDTVMQAQVPDELIGRVYGVGMLAAFSLLPLGYAYAGTGARVFGPDAVLISGGVCGVLLCSVFVLTMKGSVTEDSEKLASATSAETL